MHRISMLHSLFFVHLHRSVTSWLWKRNPVIYFWQSTVLLLLHGRAQLNRSLTGASCVWQIFMPWWFLSLAGSCHHPPTRFDAALGAAEHVDDVTRDQHHGRQSHEPPNHLAPQWVHILPQSQRGHLYGAECKHSQADEWSEDHPTEFPPDAGPVPNHVFNILIKSLCAVKPGNGHSFKEDEVKQTHPTGGIVIKELEHVQPALCDIGETDDKGDETHNEDEDLLSFPQ